MNLSFASSFFSVLMFCSLFSVLFCLFLLFFEKYRTVPSAKHRYERMLILQFWQFSRRDEQLKCRSTIGALWAAFGNTNKIQLSKAEKKHEVFARNNMHNRLFPPVVVSGCYSRENICDGAQTSDSSKMHPSGCGLHKGRFQHPGQQYCNCWCEQTQRHQNHRYIEVDLLLALSVSLPTPNPNPFCSDAQGPHAFKTDVLFAKFEIVVKICRQPELYHWHHPDPKPTLLRSLVNLGADPPCRYWSHAIWKMMGIPIPHWSLVWFFPVPTVHPSVYLAGPVNLLIPHWL